MLEIYRSWSATALDEFLVQNSALFKKHGFSPRVAGALQLHRREHEWADIVLDPLIKRAFVEAHEAIELLVADLKGEIDGDFLEMAFVDDCYFLSVELEDFRRIDFILDEKVFPFPVDMYEHI